jgi:hypothetical protein
MKGFWNGEPAKIEGITYEVSQAVLKNHWQNVHVGKRRQGLRITQGGETWIIDNEHGDGYYKVTKGMGMWRSGHKDVTNPQRIVIIPDGEIKATYDAESIKRENLEHDEFIKANDPEGYARILALRAGLAEHQRKYNM